MINKSKIFALILVVVLSVSFAVTAYAAAPTSLTTGSRVTSDEELVDETEKVVWERVDGKFRCVDLNGEPVSGWVKRGEYIYYLGKDGFPKTGWVKSNAKWYYLYDEKDIDKFEIAETLVGTLATDTWIDNYYVDKTGAQVKTKK